MSLPLFKRGGTQILKISKGGGEPEKSFGVGETKGGGGSFSEIKGVNQTFLVEFRDRKGQEWGQLGTN